MAFVEFKNVYKRYKMGDVTINASDGVSFEINKGEFVVIVGPSGAGKSTVASLLPRFYEVTDGRIVIDGCDIREVTMESLREQVGIVPQETLLFNGTVYDNILYGRLDATEEEVLNAAKAANAHNFILELPNGYETQLGDRGVNISGGQRQRVAIARAFLKNAPILILDEATSALDSETEVCIQKSFDELADGRTTLAIAHRLSTLRNMDRIVVLKGGHVIEQGTHSALLRRGGEYARLWKMQSGGFIQE